MFYGASSFNQNISGWNVSKVTNMTHMFYGASSFNQNISGWDVSQATVSDMFRGATALQQNLRRLQATSFFDGASRNMSRAERKLKFDVLFPWSRRKAYVMFLVGNGYLYCESVRRIDNNIATTSTMNINDNDNHEDVAMAVVPAVAVWLTEYLMWKT
jgi:surface protein